MIYHSEHNYTPDPHKSPCYKGFLCKHHRETNGKCRGRCLDYALFENEKNMYQDEKLSTYVANDYKSSSVDRLNRRLG